MITLNRNALILFEAINSAEQSNNNTKECKLI